MFLTMRKGEQVDLGNCADALNHTLDSIVFSFTKQVTKQDVSDLKSRIIKMAECQKNQLIRLTEYFGILYSPEYNIDKIDLEKDKLLGHPLFEGYDSKVNRIEVLRLVQAFSDHNAELLWGLKRKYDK